MLLDPAKVAVTPVASTVDRVTQHIVHVDRQGKSAVLADLLRDEPIDRALVFTRTKHGADKVVRGLANAGIAAHAIHGNKSQNQRERVLGEFRSGKIRTLVATDIAARGIDVDGISHVINYDLPNIPESYVHRIGRTARAGADGIAISFCDNEETAFLRDIEKLIQMKLQATERRAVPRNDAAPHHRPQQDRNGRNGNRRNGQQQRRNGGGNGHSGRNEHPHQGRGEHARGKPRRNGQQQGEKRHNGESRHAPRPSSPDNIGTVAFMQQPSRPAQVAGDEHRNSR